jgi:tRNA nucleotidyltransferase (CCA-adding enzyme)
VWQELNKALSCTAPGRFFEVLADAGALSPWLAEVEGLDVAFPPVLGSPLGRFGCLGWFLAPERMEALCQRLRVPRRYQRLSGLVARFGRNLAAWRQAPPELLLEAVSALGAFTRDRDPEPVLVVVEACADVDLGSLREVLKELAAVTAAAFQRQGLAGRELGDAIARARLDLIRRAQAV